MTPGTAQTDRPKLFVGPGFTSQAGIRPPPRPTPPVVIPRTAVHYTGAITVVRTAADAAEMLDFVSQRDITSVGIDTEFRYSTPAVVMPDGKTTYRVRDVVPLLVSLAFVEPATNGGVVLYRFVVDVRVSAARATLPDLFRLPAVYVGHSLKAELFCLWQLGVTEPATVWDTMVCEAALHLGVHHPKNVPATRAAGSGAGADAAAAARESTLGLLATCGRYRVDHPFRGDKDRLRQSFLDHPPDAPFRPEQIEYAAADAVAAAGLYLPQVAEAARRGVLTHLAGVEMPTVVTVARATWRGVRYDPAKTAMLRLAAAANLPVIRARLRDAFGIENPSSYPQLGRFFTAAGVIDFFVHDGKATFDKEQLEACLAVHPAVAPLRAVRRILDMEKQLAAAEVLAGPEGRVHPEFRVLGAASGRLTGKWPNVMGLGRVFRPLVVPTPGYGIGEADWAQIEVGVTGAVYGDADLVRMFNTEDVYVAMARTFFANDLPAGAAGLTAAAFKRQHGSYRDKMKVCTLGVIYGLTAHGLATRMGVSAAEAEAFIARFVAMFPALRAAQHLAPTRAALKGCVSNVSGLRRYRARGGHPTTLERNWVVNYPVQGAAATAFKLAINRLDQLYRPLDAWLLIPMHDAVVFEAPLARLPEAADLTRRVMVEVVREVFPVLRPRVDVNVSHPGCWNKDGRHDSLETWAADPCSAT